MIGKCGDTKKKNNYGIILFIYDRPQCTERVLESLKRNHIKELYVFQDGLGEKTNKTGWKQNKDIIDRIDWCKIIYKQNKYKASSLDSQVIYGINKVFEQKDAIIVIEDDCVISDDCVQFMESCLEKYQNNQRIIDIGAYLEPIKISEDYHLPVIAAGIPAGQVWGTWKDRWEEFQKEFSVVEKIGNSMKNYPIFSSCGYPIKRILTKYWLLSTWDLWWAIYVLLKEGISIRPRGNKVFNIGFENPGTHTSGESLWVVPICNKIDNEDELPDDIRVEKWAEEEFARFYENVNGGKSIEERQTYYRNCLEKWLEFKQHGKCIADILLDQGINRVAIYGIGNIGKLLVNELIDKIEIVFFIVTNKNNDKFMRYKIYDARESFWKNKKGIGTALIVIPGYDMEKIRKEIGNQFPRIYSLDDLFI